MKVISDTLKPYIETWDDPGDYPSGAGSGPLPSHDYVAEVEGEVTIELEDEDLCELISQTFEPDLEHSISVTKWEIVKLAGRKLTFAVKEFNAGAVERPEPDYWEE